MNAIKVLTLTNIYKSICPGSRLDLKFELSSLSVVLRLTLQVFLLFRCRRCFFDGDQKLATFLLFHLPLLILLCLNLFFFVVTVTKLKSTWDLGKSYNMNTSSKVLQIRLVRSKNRNRLMGNGLA